MSLLLRCRARQLFIYGNRADAIDAALKYKEPAVAVPATLALFQVISLRIRFRSGSENTTFWQDFDFYCLLANVLPTAIRMICARLPRDV